MGVKETKVDKNKRSLKLINELVNDYQPYAMVVEDYAGKGSRRCRRIEGLIDDISNLAAKPRIKVRSFSRVEVKRAFAESESKTKYEIAIAIAKRFPELTPRLPRFRNPWMSEDYRMSIFNAMGLASTFFFKLKNKNSDKKRTKFFL